MKLILDASCIIAFYSKNELNNPTILHNLINYGYELIVPIGVLKEIEKGRKITYNILKKAIDKKIISTDPDGTEQQVKKMEARYPKLHIGEIQVILTGIACKNASQKYFCIIDEGAGRDIGKNLSLRLKGTQGLIRLLNDLKIIDDKLEQKLFNRLEVSDFRVKIPSR